MRKSLCDPEQSIRLRHVMDTSTPLIINLAKGKLGSDVTDVLDGLILSLMAQAAYTRVNLPEHKRKPYYLR
ncbi:hypothetical protein F9L33_10345 [Amylibacter sp. SFDW26]|uniref:hypothetical protein n=1 Tax=Amylibacter sp. SFDW26 TaxID=2652722 RepID=UPI0012618C6B|nr:hypothetical protein [Amylibacter sp. SFDW26]KAB7613762.1 hypothetical protein F9L33_10345 [Amylibacter sp. SFDW26]